MVGPHLSFDLKESGGQTGDSVGALGCCVHRLEGRCRLELKLERLSGDLWATLGLYLESIEKPSKGFEQRGVVTHLLFKDPFGYGA